MNKRMLPLIRYCLLLILLVRMSMGFAQVPDSSRHQQDSSSHTQKDSLRVQPDSSLIIKDSQTRHNPVDSLLQKNIFLNSTQTPESPKEISRKTESRDAAFYILAVLLFMLGLLKLAYSRYFSNLQRVFFNTSLRQSQLTDQLLQAKLPSLLFNLFFVMIGGYYIFLLMVIFRKASFNDWYFLLPLCIAALLVIYLVKYWVLKFAGWITGYRSQAETYIFIVFLVNKMIALSLVPLVIIMTFSQPGLVRVALIASFVVVGTMILMRFFRSYGLLHQGIRVSRLHFFLYIIGIEVLPLLLIYRSAMLFIGQNL